MSYTGTQVNYYFVCKRKLWLFSHDLTMEHSSDLVRIGKLVHEGSYQRKFKEVMIGNIKLDFIRKGIFEIHEVKKSRKIERAHEYQLLYYLYYLKRLSLAAKGFINYPLLRRTVEVELTEEREEELEGALTDMGRLLVRPEPPPPERKGYCKKCSYAELCWS